MNLMNNFCKADEGKYFILTEKGKQECASFRSFTVGKPITSWKLECPLWAIEKGFLIETDNPNWVNTTGYKVVYDYKGHQLTAGNPYIFPDRQLAENYKAYYESRPWFNENLYIVETIYQGELKPCRMYNGKRVYNTDWWITLDAFIIGDYVEEEIVDEVSNSVPLAFIRSDCMQLNEPHSSRIDENGNIRDTYCTFKKVAKGIYEYCGDCFRGENVKRGKEISYV